MTTTTEVLCPKCGGEMWNNIGRKTNPKAPDYKCKDKSCEGVIWPPKNGRNGAVQPPRPQDDPYTHPTPVQAPPVRAKQPVTIGDLPDDPQPGGPSTFATLAARHRQCVEWVVQHEVPLIGDVDGATVSSLAAQLFIERSKRGI